MKRRPPNTLKLPLWTLGGLFDCVYTLSPELQVAQLQEATSVFRTLEVDIDSEVVLKLSGCWSFEFCLYGVCSDRSSWTRGQQLSELLCYIGPTP